MIGLPDHWNLMGLSDFTATLAREMQRADTNQSELGRKAAAAPAMLSAWLRGQTANPEPQKVFDVERALGLPPGYLSRHLGFVPYAEDETTCDVPTAIDADSSIDEFDKGALQLLYNVFRNRRPE